jgi:hypothetical protein
VSAKNVDYLLRNLTFHELMAHQSFVLATEAALM